MSRARPLGLRRKEDIMLNFTIGPVQMDDDVRRQGAEPIPYFRTPEFSAVMLENERIMTELAGAGRDARAVFLTGSGTAAMEAAVMNLFTPADRLLIVDGGSFGHRFVQICDIHGIPHDELVPPPGEGVTAEMLSPFSGRGYTGFLVNLDETSTGVLYDIRLIGDFCARNGIFLVVDAISAFLCDPIDMAADGIQVMLTGSQKALACAPGVAVMVLSPEAVGRIGRNRVQSLYFDLKAALKDGERGQTPFTPAVGTLLQIHVRLRGIEASGGAAAEIAKTAALARDFREKIADLPFVIGSRALPNGVTPLCPTGVSAYEVFTRLKDEYAIWVCPNGGDLKDKLFRVGHLGALTPADNTTLVEAMRDLQKRGLL